MKLDIQQHFLHSPKAVMFLLAIITFSLTSYFSVSVFQEYPFTHDEYVNKYQAEIFASGRLKQPANVHLWGLFEVFMLKDNNWNIFSKYPPAFSSILALGVKLGIPELINPLISVVTILIIFSTLSMVTTPVLAASVSFLLSINSYFLAYGGSYFAQSLSLCLTACTFHFFCKYILYQDRRALHRSGIFIALLIITRPLDAFCLMLALMLTLFFEPKNGKHYYTSMGVLIAWFVAGTLLLLLYNFIQARCICIAMYPIWDAEFKIYDMEANGFVANILSIIRQYAESLPEYMDLNFSRKLVPIIGVHFLLLALVGLVWRPGTLLCTGIILIAIMVLLYNFHQNTGVFRENSGWPQYGTRYWYPLIVPLSLLAARGLELVWKILPRWCYGALLVGMVILQCIRLDSDIKEYRQRFDDVARLQKIWIENCPPPSIITLFKSEDDWFFYLDKEQMITIDDFKRNAFFSGKYLVVSFPYQARDLSRYMGNKYNVCKFIMPPDIMKDWHPERNVSAVMVDPVAQTD